MRQILRLAAAVTMCAALPVSGSLLAAQEVKIPWESGPVEGILGVQSKVNVAEGCLFTAEEGSKQFLTMTQNPTNGRERGTAFCSVVRPAGDTAQWFAVFEYEGGGYVRDDDKAEIDGDAILKSLKSGNEAGNEARKERGWEPIHLVGWERAPYYDESTHNLTWATRLRDDSGSETINHSVRLLGRGGVMSVDLVVDPVDYAAALPQFESLIGTHEYLAGHKYSEWRDGDKVAEYGLTALVAGGAGVLAVKSGILAKAWKLIAGVVIAAMAGLKRMFSRKKE